MQKGKGFLIFSCELIDDNGKELENCVLRYADQWKLGTAFTDWVREENLFCSTLVDRIVTGYPREEADAICRQLGYEDQLLDTGEPFGFWVIRGTTIDPGGIPGPQNRSANSDHRQSQAL